ncbi:hypothetical protein ACLOJK_022646 [Asimina triloba]
MFAAPEVNLLNTKRTRLVKPFKKPTAAIKTIQNEVGDIIDCVDIYKQPAFDHPALKNHTIQVLLLFNCPTNPFQTLSSIARENHYHKP